MIRVVLNLGFEFNLGLYFLTLDLTKTKVLLILGLKSFVIRAIVSCYFIADL